jgi:hypothetical protein
MPLDAATFYPNCPADTVAECIGRLPEPVHKSEGRSAVAVARHADCRSRLGTLSPPWSSISSLLGPLLTAQMGTEHT